MMRLKDKSRGVPDGFRFTNAETAWVSRGTNYWEWENAIMDHRKGNKLPIPDNMMEIAEDQLCQQLDPWHCKHADANTKRVPTRFNVGDVVNGMKAFGKAMLGLVNFVDQAEADRRAKICASCFLNVNAEGCSSCAKVAKLIAGDLAKKKTAWDASLRVCAICKCLGAAKVWFPIRDIPTDEAQQSLFPEFCWQKINGCNYVEVAA